METSSHSDNFSAQAEVWIKLLSGKGAFDNETFLAENGVRRGGTENERKLKKEIALLEVSLKEIKDDMDFFYEASKLYNSFLFDMGTLIGKNEEKMELPVGRKLISLWKIMKSQSDMCDSRQKRLALRYSDLSKKLGSKFIELAELKHKNIPGV